MPRLTEPMKLRDLIEKGVIFQLDANDVNEDHPDSEEENETKVPERHLAHINKECVGMFDEDTYEEGEPFEIIAKKMINLTPDGKIKKRVIREGDGPKPEQYATVKIHYNGYLEYDDEPFDSTYARHKPLKFTVNSGKVLAGLNFAVQTMKLNEKSQFLIHPDYAYGKNICIGKIPSNATILFEVELCEVINSGATITFEQLPEEEQRSFSEVYKYCTALKEKGKQSFIEHNIKNAIKDYNTAVSKLEKVCVSGKEEIEKHRDMSLKLYTNLLICYTRTKEPKKGISNAKKIYNLTENGELMTIPAKVYFNHAKCLRVLSEYDAAKEMLTKAHQLEPKNPEIANEFLLIEKEKEDHKKSQMIFAKALIGK